MTDETKGKLRPTIVTTPLRRASVPSANTASSVQSRAGATQTIAQPTVVAGTARERIKVTAADLRILLASAPAGVIEAALALLTAFVIAKANERKAILWGHDLQKSYADAVAEALALSQAPVMRKATGHIARMLEILGSFDVMSVVEPSGGISRFLKGMNNKTDTIGELVASRKELDQIVRLMDDALGELIDLKDKLEKNARALEAIAKDAESHALAALYLSEYLRPERPAIAERFVERSMSLTQTVAQIRGNSVVRDMQLEQPIRMISSIQHVTTVSMPDLLSSLAAINSLAVQNTMISPTAASELNYKLQDVIRQLKT